MNKGTLYGVGVGPGDPSLMTLKAVETIHRCQNIAAPQTKGGAMVALDIAAGAASMEGKTIIPLAFSMSLDAETRAASHKTAAQALMALLDKGQDVAMLNLGDVSIYASFQYIHSLLKQQGYPVVMIPGIPSFCAAAAELGVSLTEMDKPLHIIPASAKMRGGIPEEGGSYIYMKAGSALPGLLEELGRTGKLENAMMVQNCGMENQRVYKTLKDAQVENAYFSLTIVKEAADEG